MLEKITRTLVAAATCLAFGQPVLADESPKIEPPARIADAGELRYGTAATFPPFEYQKEDVGLTGFDIDMIETLAGYMGVEAEPLDIAFDGLIPALAGNRIDIINSGMYINDERAKKVDFVPYMVIGEAMIVKSGNPPGIEKLPEDLSGLDVAVTRGAIGEEYMKDFNRELKDLGMKPMNILTFPTNQDAMLAVKSGRANAFDTSIPGAAHLNEQRPGEFEVAATFDLGTKIGIATRPDDDELRKAIDKAMSRFVESGEYERLLDKYNFPAEVNYFNNE